MVTRAPRYLLGEFRDDIRAKLREYGVVQAGVFGSTARGEDRPGSDLDLIVEFEPGRKRDVMSLTSALEDLTGLHVDIVDYEVVSSRVKRTGLGSTILRDTVPL